MQSVESYTSCKRCQLYQADPETPEVLFFKTVNRYRMLTVRSGDCVLWAKEETRSELKRIVGYHYSLSIAHCHDAELSFRIRKYPSVDEDGIT